MEAAGEEIEVTGVVQGVGFRPFVHALAHALALTGCVRNDRGTVRIELFGGGGDRDRFVAALWRDAPPPAVVDSVSRRPIPGDGPAGFSIVASAGSGRGVVAVAPDAATCEECLDELHDPANRRHRHPFITCTRCGPRYTIVRALPYDRDGTTMAGFSMCERCAVEYGDPTDRRHHAQPISCHDCGPSLWFESAARRHRGDPIEAARRALRRGEIVAAKGIGGYHLLCDATNDDAIAELRRRKARPDKPFAVMVTVDALDSVAAATAPEVGLLRSPAAPIVLVRRRPVSDLSPLVAPDAPLLGVVLPYSPVHHLLVEDMAPLVVTSANRSGEPLAHTADDIGDLCHLHDGLLDHDRPIATPCDDSVVRLDGGSVVPLRRARGHVPLTVRFPAPHPDVLAVGADGKNTVCVASDGVALVSQHLGDAGSVPAERAAARAIETVTGLAGAAPAVVAHDLHPDHRTTRRAEMIDAEPVAVQHHHAHVAAVMAEHGLDPHEPVLGVAFDGTGFGPDGTIWGGEFLVTTAGRAERVAHLRSVWLPGGDLAARTPWRSALAHLVAAGIDPSSIADRWPAGPGEVDTVRAQIDASTAGATTSSVGRLFDAVAATLDVCRHPTFEAHAPMAVERLAATWVEPEPGYGFLIDGSAFDAGPVLRAMVADVLAGEPSSRIAWRFHAGLADVVGAIAERTQRPVVALTGGCFQNTLLLDLCRGRLRAAGFDVRSHRRVPPNDGGISLGQAFVAAYGR